MQARRRICGTAATAVLAVAVVGCSAIPGAGPGDPEPSLTLDAALPEFHGAMDVTVAAALNIFPAGGCEPAPDVICGRNGRVEYRPADDPQPVTMTDATMAMDNNQQFWEVRLDFDARRPLVAARRLAAGFGGTILLIRGDEVLVTGRADTITGATMVVDRLDKAAAYQLLERLQRS